MKLSERLAGGDIEQVHQLGIVLLLKMMQSAADHPVRAQFASQGGQFFTGALSQKRLGNPQRTTEASDDAADGRYFHLRCSVAHQKDFSISYLPAHRHPPAINRNACALPFER